MAQTFYPITPTEIVPGSADDWVTMDASAVVPANATGVIIHAVNNQATNNHLIGLRKNGSTDDRTENFLISAHWWAAIGVDASRYFEAYVGSTTEIDIYVVGYTMAGVTFSTNADDMSLGDTAAWTAIDCSTEAPSAIGLIFEILGASATWYEYGLRKNGSSDDRHFDTLDHDVFGAIIGCDASQICEGYIENTAVDFFLVGHITDGATFNLNATDVSLGANTAWTDLTALPATANMGFIEVCTTATLNYGLRKDGSAEELYYDARRHPWGIVECASLIIEGKIESTAVDFFVVGYSTVPAASVVVTPPTLSLTLTKYAPSIIIGTIVIPSTLSLILTKYAPILKEVLTPGTLSLSITTYSPSIVVTGNKIITPDTAHLIITKYSPILKEVITPSTLSLTLTAYAPSLVYGTVITPTTLNLILTEYAPILVEGTVITPGKLGLTLTGYAPILKEVITPGVLHLILTQYAPHIIFGVLPSGALGYIIEVRDSSGNLLAFLENAHGINLVEQLNRPPMLDFLLPADDSKISHIDPDNEIWLRDYDTGVLIKKFLVSRRRDTR